MVCRKQSCRLREGTQIDSLARSGIAELDDAVRLGRLNGRHVPGRVGLHRGLLGHVSRSVGTAVTNLPPQAVI